MKITICDKCGKEIKEDVTMVLDHDLCPECAKAVDIFITRMFRAATMDEIRDFCNNFSKECSECPFYDEGCDECELKTFPCNWSSEKEIFSKFLDYKVNHPDWRKVDE